MRPGRRTHASSRGGSGMSKVREVVVPGARLSVEIRGEGSPALVMLHGLASDRRSWDRVVAELGLHTCTIRYDLRGSGQSVASDDKPFRHASDLHALLDAMGVECCDLLGDRKSTRLNSSH